MVQFVLKQCVAAMVNGVNGQQIASSMIVYGQLDFQKARHIFKLHLMALTGAVTLQMVSMK
jgi:hypothetical protein